jgi:hypothetical protein
MSLQNFRSYKIFGLAIFDLSISFIFMIVIFMVAWRTHFKRLKWWKFLLAAILVTIPIGITFHVLFGVNTQLNYDLGLSNKPMKV